MNQYQSEKERPRHFQLAIRQEHAEAFPFVKLFCVLAMVFPPVDAEVHNSLIEELLLLRSELPPAPDSQLALVLVVKDVADVRVRMVGETSQLATRK